jgi:hypothetical protein
MAMPKQEHGAEREIWMPTARAVAAAGGMLARLQAPVTVLSSATASRWSTNQA